MKQIYRMLDGSFLSVQEACENPTGGTPRYMLSSPEELGDALSSLPMASPFNSEALAQKKQHPKLFSWSPDEKDRAGCLRGRRNASSTF